METQDTDKRVRFIGSSENIVGNMPLPYLMDASSFLDKSKTIIPLPFADDKNAWVAQAYREVLDKAVPVSEIKQHLEKAPVAYKKEFSDELLMLAIASAAFKFTKKMERTNNPDAMALHTYAKQSLAAVRQEINAPLKKEAEAKTEKPVITPVRISVPSAPKPTGFVKLKSKQTISTDNAVHLTNAMEEFRTIASTVNLIVRGYDEEKMMKKTGTYPLLLAALRHSATNYDKVRVSRRMRRNPYWRLTARIALQIAICERLMLWTTDSSFRVFLLGQITILNTVFMTSLRNISSAEDFMEAMKEQYISEVNENITSETRKTFCLSLDTV